MQGNIFNENNLDELFSDIPHLQREHLVTIADVHNIARRIQNQLERFASDDGHSVLLWVQKLRARGVDVFLKCAGDDPGSTGLDRDTFVMIIQTPAQRKLWETYGHGRFAGIDGTHNTTHYTNMNLYTVLARDDHGHGVPCAFMLSNSGTEITLKFYLQTLLKLSPHVIPRNWMSDRDQGQLNAITDVYITPFDFVRLFLCWWHVLHAWQQHFNTYEFPELWERLKHWIRIDDAAVFASKWDEIKAMVEGGLAPRSVINYIQEYWLPEKYVHLWSAVYRTSRTIFDDCDTNMLAEAYVIFNVYTVILHD